MDGFYTYILECSDGTLYTGWTTNIEKRVKKHNKGKGAKYTKSRLPVSLKKFWAYESRSEAMKVEYAIKQLTRQQKLELINA
jgi:putative endonuclease